MGTTSTFPARLVLVGVRGFGQVHAERIARLSDQGLVKLVAAVDPGVVLDPPMIYGAQLYADLADALSAVGPVDVVVIAAPLGEHFRLAKIALSAGADVYLEKPPVASLDSFAMGRPAELGWSAGHRRSCHERIGACSDHRAQRCRLPPAGRCRGSRDRSLSRQCH